MSSYIYRKKPNPVVDHNLYELISNPTTFGYNTPVGGQLAVTNFFEVLNADEDIIGFLWFDFYSVEKRKGELPLYNFIFHRLAYLHKTIRLSEFLI